MKFSQSIQQQGKELQESFYPFPYEALKEELLEYPQAEIYWAQEEPSNMGAFRFVKHRVESVNQSITGKYEELLFIGRKASASPATGIANRHAENQLNILRLATESERSEIKDNKDGVSLVKFKLPIE
jgi:2-oxoglutarate dehydrogenase complex dehydrogenase (E1) component-like enzyme